MISSWRSFHLNLTHIFSSVNSFPFYSVINACHLCRQDWPTQSFLKIMKIVINFLQIFSQIVKINFLNLFFLAKNVNCKLIGANPSCSSWCQNMIILLNYSNCTFSGIKWQFWFRIEIGNKRTCSKRFWTLE